MKRVYKRIKKKQEDFYPTANDAAALSMHTYFMWYEQ